MAIRMIRKAEKAYYDRNYKLSITVKRLLGYAAKQKKDLIIMFILLISNSVIAIVLPLIIRTGLNELENPSGLNFTFIETIGWLYLVGTIIAWIVTYAMNRVQWIIIANAITNVRLQMFDKLQEMDVGFYDKNQTGRLMSRVLDDSNRMGNLINLFPSFFSSISLVIVMLAILFSINAKLTLECLMVFPVVLLLVFGTGKILQKFSMEVRRTRAAVNAAVQESVTGVSVAKGFNREERNRIEFIDLNRDNLKANLRLSYLSSVIFPIINFITIFVMFLIINSGGKIVINGNLRIGDLYLFYVYILSLFGPVMQISQQIVQINAGSAATSRIFSLLDLKSNMKAGNLIPQNIRGEIEFKNVSFSYIEEQPVYTNLSLKIPDGQTVALVGHTGAGKTTLVSLLSRFYEIHQGEILVDNINVQNIDIETYRSFLGIVLQDPYLFSGTIEDNIKYGKLDASDEEVQKAISLTHLDEFIDSLPEGIKTDVLERGSRLSTGQRQLVTFARALVANPAILILDEATASVDAYTESMIQKGLENLFKRRTSIVVAHRLSTIINADRILVFDHGKIVGDGNHNYLIENNEIYRELYKTYYEFQGLLSQIKE